MPSKLRAGDRDREKEVSSKPKDKDRPKSSYSRKILTKDRESGRDKQTERPSTTIDPKRRSSMPGTGTTDRSPSPSASASKTSLPYPSFSKAHSKEAVGARDSMRPTLNIFTPDPTDINASKGKLSSPRSQNAPGVGNAPPSPPLTSLDENKPINGARHAALESVLDDKKSWLEDKIKIRLKTRSTKSNGSLGHSRSGSDLGARSKPSTPAKTRLQDESRIPQRSTSQPLRPKSPTLSVLTTTETTTESLNSDTTSIAPNQPPTYQKPSIPVETAGRHTINDTMSPSTSTPKDSISRKATPLEVFVDDDRTPASDASNHPPPPPPPPVMPINIPKVDYLLHNGGLPQNVPKNLLHAGKPMVVQQAAMTPHNRPPAIANLFEPYNKLLDDFGHVISRNGSLAVATGYRSVARRLLDRLEAVFARDISSETCRCIMCGPRDPERDDDFRGVNWGEVLELVSGRRDLPPWPAFTFIASPVGLGISLENHVPMQKLDIDVPEEYREHYIRQSRKTKQTVDKWLARQTDTPTSPPEEVDDETLTFAILTHLDQEQRPLFSNLLGIVTGPIEPRAPTPQPRYRSETLITSGLAIQRLYRLSAPPRDPETAIYLLNHPDLHNALATLAAVSNDEWDILTSGRFDGFLRSGAEDAPPQTSPTRNGSSSRTATPSRPTFPPRGPTPLYANGSARPPSQPFAPMSRGPTPAPAAFGAPVALDEETEIAALAEIEREIFLGMEAMEDAFEALHSKAETVRQALRERGAGLTMASQARRGSAAVEVRMGTPASGQDMRWESETDDGNFDDGMSELAPDDSASNISSSRRRRPKRRNERRTPAMVAEEDEDGESTGSISPRKR